MQIHWDFKLSPAKYSSLGREFIVFPMLLKCPACKVKLKLYRHGFYRRNVLLNQNEYPVEICRYYCRSCQGTISLLPSFLLPRFQRCRQSILESLKGFFASEVHTIYRQAIAFYVKRFRQNMKAIIFGFRELRLMLKIPDDENEKAIKLVVLLDTLAGDPNSTGPQIHHNFMALSL